ncbi:MAG: hypothetical protein AMXMBFR58_11430 [Phycisphaerae bacterium]
MPAGGAGSGGASPSSPPSPPAPPAEVPAAGHSDPPRKKTVRVDSPTRPARPQWMSDDAKRMWTWLIPQLDAMGVLAKVDGPLLVRYCETWAKWKKTAQFLSQYGDTYVIKDGQGQPRIFMPWPQLTSFTRLSNALGRMEQELGMSPSARTRIQVEAGKSAPKRYRILEKYGRQLLPAWQRTSSLDPAGGERGGGSSAPDTAARPQPKYFNPYPPLPGQEERRRNG